MNFISLQDHRSGIPSDNEEDFVSISSNQTFTWWNKLQFNIFFKKSFQEYVADPRGTRSLEGIKDKIYWNDPRNQVYGRKAPGHTVSFS